MKTPRGLPDERVGHGLQLDSITENYLLMTHLIERTKGCKAWQLNENSHVLMQDSSFVLKKLEKER